MADCDSKTILVIDDNPSIHADFQKILAPEETGMDRYARAAASLFGRKPEVASEFPAFDLEFASRGQDGLAKLQGKIGSRQRYIMAYVDVRMPNGWDGIETIKRMWGVDPELQVVICTAHSDYSWDEIQKELGQSNRLLILKKPFDPIELRQITVSLAERARAEAQLRDAHAQLVESARKAGMAEVAAGVLHNVGNILNSVNTSCSVIEGQLRASRLSALGQAAAMIEAQRASLAHFLSEDVRGRELPNYLIALSAHLEKERDQIASEVVSLRNHIEHIRNVVRVQQKHATGTDEPEEFQIETVVRDAITVVRAGYAKAAVELIHEVAPLGVCRLKKHSVIQVLVNLLQNALQAVVHHNGPERAVTIRQVLTQDGRGRLEVADTGHGIPPEAMSGLFRFGFTTKQDGHGFGLHSAANHAREMGGTLTATSPGNGKGAVFCFEFPIHGGAR